MCVCEIGLIADDSIWTSASFNLRKCALARIRHQIDVVLSRSGPAEQLGNTRRSFRISNIILRLTFISISL